MVTIEKEYYDDKFDDWTVRKGVSDFIFKVRRSSNIFLSLSPMEP